MYISDSFFSYLVLLFCSKYIHNNPLDNEIYTQCYRNHIIKKHNLVRISTRCFQKQKKNEEKVEIKKFIERIKR